MSGRGRPGQSRYKTKRTSIISFEEFENLVNASTTNLHKSLLAILYYTGMRTAEIVGDRPRYWKKLTKKGSILSKQGLLRSDWKKTEEGDLWDYEIGDSLPGVVWEDLSLEDGVLRIFSKPLKHGKREGTGQLELQIDYPHVDKIVEQWENTKPSEKLWDISTWKAWKFISDISGGRLYPHAFRLSRATRLARDPNMSIADMQQWFGWARASTADSYLIPARSMSKIRDSIRRELPE